MNTRTGLAPRTLPVHLMFGIKLKDKIMHGNSAHEVVPNLDNINLLTIFYRVCV